jgi:hypothetical protein
MERRANAATKVSKGFQSGPVFGALRTHAYVALLMTAVLTLATLTVVATVSIEVVKAAPLH